MKPAHPLAKDRRPVKVTRLELRCGFVRAIVKDNWWPDSITAVAVDGREVGPGDSVVLKPLVKRADPHGLDPRGDQLADGIIHHRRHHAGVEPKAVRQIGSHIVFSATDVNLALLGLAKGDNSGIQAVYDGAQRDKVQRSLLFRNAEPNC